MNIFKKGPEFKLSGLKVPDFLVDLYYDLHDRRLLPLVALLVIGIVAAPFVLASNSGSNTDQSAVEGISSAAASPTSSLIVTEAKPGLRDYRRRLDHLSPTNPFRPQPSTGEEEGGSGEEGSSEAGGSTAEGETPTEGSGGGGSVPSESTVHRTITYFTYAIDVRVTPIADADGKRSKQEPTVRRDLPPLTMLPGRDTPALTYIGPTKDGKKAVMLVSDQVTALFGDATCVVGTETCQMLALEPGVPESIAWGNGGRAFKVELLKIYVEKTDELNRAPLGKPKGSGS